MCGILSILIGDNEKRIRCRRLTFWCKIFFPFFRFSLEHFRENSEKSTTQHDRARKNKNRRIFLPLKIFIRRMIYGIVMINKRKSHFGIIKYFVPGIDLQIFIEKRTAQISNTFDPKWHLKHLFRFDLSIVWPHDILIKNGNDSIRFFVDY